MEELQSQLTDIKEVISSIHDKLDLLNEVTVKNGGGRHITYQRNEFFQMLYDRGKFSKITDKLYKYGLVVLVILQIYQIANK